VSVKQVYRKPEERSSVLFFFEQNQQEGCENFVVAEYQEDEMDEYRD
jgi:hypothetical protein